MAKKSLIEVENRTTITGIIAIVFIVFLIASFMRVNEIGFFSSENTVGSATSSESFLGIRHVDLNTHEALVGHLSIQGLGQRTYYAYPDDGILVVDYGSSYVQTILVEDPEAPGIFSGTYDDRSTARVLINTLTAQLYVDDLTVVQLAPISLTSLRVFDGELSVAGKQYYFRLAGDELLITAPDERAIVSLKPQDNELVGSWNDHDVTVNSVERLITISNLY